MILKSAKSFTLQNCFDSHLHWQATGTFSHNLKLHDLTSPEQIKDLKIQSQHMRGEWLVGWGWDQHRFPEQKLPSRKVLDTIWPGVPIALTRVDGHAFWVSTEALKRAGLFYRNPPRPEGGYIHLDEEGWPTGVLIDLAFTPLERLIPKPSANQVRQDLLKGMQMLNAAGITHIRDMSCEDVQWNEACRLADQNELTVAVEQTFSADDPNDFYKILKLAVHAKRHHPRLLRPTAVKIYYDGALGSEGAYLSAPYQSGSGRGVVFLERIQLKEMIQLSWQGGLDVAVHAIGDEAAHQVVVVANELWDIGEEGRLHIEHAEMLRPETLAMMKGKNIVCHIQPCHWLSDKNWLQEKLGSLFQHVFRWSALEEEGVDFYFGSDSPIEAPNIMATGAAIEDAAQHGIRPLKSPWQLRHEHSDQRWTPNTYTEFVEGRVSQLV